MNENLFEYSDMLRSPIEAFSVAPDTGKVPFPPTGTIFWNLSMCRKDL